MNDLITQLRAHRSPTTACLCLKCQAADQLERYEEMEKAAREMAHPYRYVVDGDTRYGCWGCGEHLPAPVHTLPAPSKLDERKVPKSIAPRESE